MRIRKNILITLLALIIMAPGVTMPAQGGILKKYQPILDTIQKANKQTNDTIPDNQPQGQDDEEDALTVFDDVTLPTFDSIDAQVSFVKWCHQNLVYPEEALKKGVQGRVFVSFILEKNGTLSNVKIVRGAFHVLDQEVLRVVTSAPNKWTTAYQNGKPVRFKYILPIIFQLE